MLRDGGRLVLVIADWLGWIDVDGLNVEGWWEVGAGHCRLAGLDRCRWIEC